MAKQLTFPRQLIDRRPVAAPTPFAPKPAATRPELRWRLPNANVVVTGAAAGFVVGLVLWGFIALSFLGAVGSLLAQPAKDPTVAAAAETEVLNCASFGAVRALSADDEARFQAQCGSQTSAATQPTAAPSAQPQVRVGATTNRAHCDIIRGNAYLSDEERTWFLDNCVEH